MCSSSGIFDEFSHEFSFSVFIGVIELLVISSAILLQMNLPITAAVFLIALFEAVLSRSEAGCLV